MRTIVAMTVLMLAASAARATDEEVVPAGGTELFAGPVTVEPTAGRATRSLVARAAVIDRRAGTAVGVTTRLNPVVGSVQRGHFTNPFTGKSNYRSTTYNPVLGSFGTYKFRR